MVNFFKVGKDIFKQKAVLIDEFGDKCLAGIVARLFTEGVIFIRDGTDAFV